jgi:hypothetical protein
VPLFSFTPVKNSPITTRYADAIGVCAHDAADLCIVAPEPDWFIT